MIKKKDLLLLVFFFATLSWSVAQVSMKLTFTITYFSFHLQNICLNFPSKLTTYSNSSVESYKNDGEI